MTRVVSLRTRILTIGMLAVAFLVPFVAFAAIPGEIQNQLGAAAKGAGTEAQSGEQLVVIISRIITVSLSLLGIVLVGLLVYAGWLWMTAAGSEEQVTKAKTLIRNAIIGLIIVLFAFAISRFVIGRLFWTTSNAPRL